jgi:hypothetical protein
MATEKCHSRSPTCSEERAGSSLWLDSTGCPVSCRLQRKRPLGLTTGGRETEGKVPPMANVRDKDRDGNTRDSESEQRREAERARFGGFYSSGGHPVSHRPGKQAQARTAPNWAKWQHMASVELWQAVALSMNFEPTPKLLKLTNPEFHDRLEIAGNAYTCGQLGLQIIGRPPSSCHVGLKEFSKWVRDRAIPWKLPAEFPLPDPQQDSQSLQKNVARSWPWGTYETELLGHLSAAVQEFWTKYDPTKPRTAPTSAKVEAWLGKRGVKVRVRQIMAQIIRADDAPKGPRPL